MDRSEEMSQTQTERDRQEFIELLQFLEKSDPDGFPALCAKLKTILTKEGENIMDKAHTQAQATRERNLAARAAWYEEQAAAKKVARLALQRVTENPEATPAELLEAAKLLAELTH